MTRKRLNDGWEEYDHTVVGLKDYVDMRFEEIEKSRMAALTALDNARRESVAAIEQNRKDAQSALEKRLDAMNEIRGTLRDQSDLMMPRAEYALKHEQLSFKIEELQKFKNQMEGKASQASVYWSYAIAIIAIALTLVKFFVK